MIDKKTLKSCAMPVDRSPIFSRALLTSLISLETPLVRASTGTIHPSVQSTPVALTPPTLVDETQGSVYTLSIELYVGSHIILIVACGAVLGVLIYTPAAVAAQRWYTVGKREITRSESLVQRAACVGASFSYGAITFPWYISHVWCVDPTITYVC